MTAGQMPKRRTLSVHWLRFSLVGLMGIGWQLVCLYLLVDLARWHYTWATILAVEAAILHNFIWHELWTWSDRTRVAQQHYLRRLLSFNLGTALTSILGNLVLMYLFVGLGGLHYIWGNILAVGCCYVLNFAYSEWVVFRPGLVLSALGLSLYGRF